MSFFQAEIGEWNIEGEWDLKIHKEEYCPEAGCSLPVESEIVILPGALVYTYDDDGDPVDMAEDQRDQWLAENLTEIREHIEGSWG